MATNGADLHGLARWVENLPSDDQRMAQVGVSAELNYADGTFQGGGESELLIDDFLGGQDPVARDRWLDLFATAVTKAAP